MNRHNLLMRVQRTQVEQLEKLLADRPKVASLFERVRSERIVEKTTWTHGMFYPGCCFARKGDTFRRRVVDRDTIVVIAQLGQEVFYIKLREDASYTVHFVDGGEVGVEPEVFDEILQRLSALLDGSAKFLPRRNCLAC